MKKITQRIVDIVNLNKGRGVWIPRDFYGILEEGFERRPVFLALDALAQRGTLRRIAPGFYDVPYKFNGVTQPTKPEWVAEALRRRNDARIVHNGKVQASYYDLIDDEPKGLNYLTDSSSRVMRIQDQILTFKHAEPNVMAWTDRAGGDVVLALLWIGRETAEDPETIRHMQEHVPADEMAGLRKDMWRLRYWLLRVVRQIVADS